MTAVVDPNAKTVGEFFREVIAQMKDKGSNRMMVTALSGPQVLTFELTLTAVEDKQ